MKKFLRISFCALSICPIGMALGQHDFSTFVTFGDSLTNNDLLGIAYGNPQDLYGEDAAEAVFSQGARGNDQLDNYAVAGSMADDISRQIDLYEWWQKMGMQNTATLINFEIGGNDIKDNIDDLAASPPGKNSATDEIIAGLLDTMQEDMLRIYEAHPEARFIVWTIPDVTITPQRWGEFTRSETNNILAHMEVINRYIRSLDQYSFVIVLDLCGLFQQMVANPPSDGTHQLRPPPAQGDYDTMFADEIHPTAVSNAILANAIIGKMNSKWKGAIPFYAIPELLDLAHVAE